MAELRAITTVYSYYLPEVREVVTRLTAAYPHDVFLRSISPGLDDLHQPIIERLIDKRRAEVPALSSFAHRYPTSGSEEGIREYMTSLQQQGVRRVHMLRGDYEGYREVAKSRGLEMLESDDPRSLPPGHWFLSNPSARDGNHVSPDLIRDILEAGHKVFCDLSYLGSTDPQTYDLSHPNVSAAAISFSKPLGLFYYRIGFLFTKEPVAALYANKWFKHVFSLLVADAVLRELDLAAIAKKYKAVQREIVAELRRTTELSLTASDAFLLAHAKIAPAGFERYRRHDTYRFCLTPYFLERCG